MALRALYRTAREVAQGMVHLHCAHVIHGDLKPANVLLMNSRKDRRGFVAKVSDFGLAQYCPAAGIVKDAPWGTLVFMAPERFRLNMLSPASDVWSFGVMLVRVCSVAFCVCLLWSLVRAATGLLPPLVLVPAPAVGRYRGSVHG